METSIASIPKLPNDLIIEILTRLPVKSLSKFRCVSKSWFSIISNRQFAKTHLENSKKDSDFTTHRIIMKFHCNFKHCSVYSLLHEPITNDFDSDYSFNLSSNLVWVVGSCDGLICLAVDRKDLILWNPCTRKWKKMPDFGVEINSGGYFAYGFGFDESSDDYKVVGFFNDNRDLSEVIFQIYSLKSGQWKRINNFKMIKNFKGRWLMDDPATFANGKLYWMANSDMGLESVFNIVSLDLETEELERLGMPNYVKSGYYSRLGESEGCLYMLCSHSTNADVWIMDDCKGSWRKVVTIPYVDDFLKYTYKKLVYVVKDGKVVLLCSSTVVIFDPNDGSFWYPEINNSGEFVALSTYFESLVSPE